MAHYLDIAFVSLGQGKFEMGVLKMTLFFILVMNVGIIVGFLLRPPLPFGEEIPLNSLISAS